MNADLKLLTYKSQFSIRLSTVFFKWAQHHGSPQAANSEVSKNLARDPSGQWANSYQGGLEGGTASGWQGHRSSAHPHTSLPALHPCPSLHSLPSGQVLKAESKGKGRRLRGSPRCKQTGKSAEGEGQYHAKARANQGCRLSSAWLTPLPSALGNLHTPSDANSCAPKQSSLDPSG